MDEREHEMRDEHERERLMSKSRCCSPRVLAPMAWRWRLRPSKPCAQAITELPHNA